MVAFLYMAMVALIGVAVATLTAPWIGMVLAGVLLLGAWPLGRWLQLPLQLGRWNLAWLAPLLWAGAVALLVGRTFVFPPPSSPAEVPLLQRDVEASATVNRTRMRVEKDRLIYTLTLRYKKGVKVRVPKITAHPTFNGPFVMPAKYPPKIHFAPPKNGMVFKRWRITLVAVAQGPLDTPRFVFRYRKGGKVHRVVVPRIAIEVTELPKPRLLLRQLRPGKPPVLVEPASALSPWIVWGGILGGTVLVLLGLWWVHRQKQLEEKIIPPHIWAEEALQELDQQNLLPVGEFKKHYFQLSEIFRGYLERRYHFQALESTTEEILPWLQENLQLPLDIFQDIRKLLRFMDQVKFAGYLPTEEESDDVARRIRSVIRKTRPLQEEEGSPPPKKPPSARERDSLSPQATNRPAPDEEKHKHTVAS